MTDQPPIELQRRILRLMNNCGNAAEVARVMGLSYDTVRRALERQGYEKLIGSTRPIKESTKEILRLFDGGMPTLSIAQTLKRSYKAVSKRLAWHGRTGGLGDDDDDED